MIIPFCLVKSKAITEKRKYSSLFSFTSLDLLFKNEVLSATRERKNSWRGNRALAAKNDARLVYYIFKN